MKSLALVHAPRLPAKPSLGVLFLTIKGLRSRLRRWITFALAATWGSVSPALATEPAVVETLSSLAGEVHGGLQVLSAEDLALRGNVRLNGRLALPGTPILRLQGKAGYGNLATGAGAASPTGHTLTLSGNAWVQTLVQRVDPIALPAAPVVQPSAGTRSVVLNQPGASLGDPATLRNLTLNGQAGDVSVPPGFYGQFIANGGAAFVLGAGGAQGPRSVYHLSGLILNGNAELRLAGPVTLVLGSTLVLNGSVGTPAQAGWLRLEFAEGAGLIANGNARCVAEVHAPGGTVTFNGNAEFTGSLAARRLVVQGNPVLRFQTTTANQAPTVALTSPAEGAVFAVGATVSLAADATDADGSIVRVEFHRADGLLASVASAPFAFAWTHAPAGVHTVTARAFDNSGAVAVSPAVTFQVVPNSPPSVALLAPGEGSSLPAADPVRFVAAASDTDGPVARVDFLNEAGDTVASATTLASLPDRYEASALLPAGRVAARARAVDASGAFADSAPVAFRLLPGLPYLTGFEPEDGHGPGRLAGAQGWTTLAGTAEIQRTDAAFGQQYAVLLPGTPEARLQQEFHAPPSSVRFYEVFARLPAALDDEPFSGFATAHARVALRVVEGAGETWVHAGALWRPTARAMRFPLRADGLAAAWTRYTVREDHGSRTWSLYVDGVLAEAGLPFQAGEEDSLPRFTAIGHPSTPLHLDDLYVGAENPVFEDHDADGIDDAYERAHGLDPNRDDSAEDLDGDGLTNLQEFLLGTRADAADSDGDGMPDGWEVRHGLDPTAPGAAMDTDGDGIADLREYQLGRNPTKGALPDDGTHVGLSVHAPAATP